MKFDQLNLEAIKNGITRPSCRNALGLLGVGLSAFVWPHFPGLDVRVVFATVFSLGVGSAAAWLGAQIDAALRVRNRSRQC